MKYYLIVFMVRTKEHGYMPETALVKADSYEEACEKIKVEYPNGTAFVNLTIE